MLGAYGFGLVGADAASAQLVEAATDWPTPEIVRRTGAARSVTSTVGAQRAEIELVGGDRLELRRRPLRATFTTADPLSDEALVHPYLAPAAAIGGYWLGREAFHAGALWTTDGVWAILGAKESGKSSLLARLALDDHRVFADDALIVDGKVAFAGPRSIDLRAEPARELGAGELIGIVGDRERWRLSLGPVESTSRLRGWVFLSWKEAVEVVPVPAASRLEQMLRHRIVKGLPPPDPRFLLELSSLPAFELGRPQRWDQLETAAALLVATLSSC